jgi:hypothetical protein
MTPKREAGQKRSPRLVAEGCLPCLARPDPTFCQAAPRLTRPRRGKRSHTRPLFGNGGRLT